MIKYDTILFDLDGTLTDPKEGITKCVQYALEKMDISAPDLEQLIPFIGPPLAQSFQEFYGMTEEQAQQAITYYRERFAPVGLLENRVFEGVEQLLHTLKESGYQLAVATSKPTVYAEQILMNFELAQYFDVIVGSHLDGRRTDKAEVIEAALAHFPTIGEALMIGDRKHDLIGATKNNLDSIGVTFGFGSLEELQEAKATYIIQSIEELITFFME